MKWFKSLFAVLAMIVASLTILAVPALAQDAPAPPGDLLVLVGLVVAVVLPYATSFIYEGVQLLLPVIGSLGKMPKVILGVIAGYGLSWVAFWLNVPLPGSLEGLTEQNILAVLEGLAAVGMHYLRGKRQKGKIPV